MQKKIKAIIIDDEQLGREVIKNYLSKHDQIELIDECENGFDGIKAINTRNPDLIFLDIQMPKINGFEMLELIEDPPVVIFVTAFDQYALKAFEVNACDYLLKPFSKERFTEAVERAVNKIKNNTANTTVYKDVTEAYKESEFLERVVVKTNQKITVIPVEKINYFEAQDDYVMLHTEDGKFLKQKTMKYFEENLNPKIFLRVHRSFIVRIDFIKGITLFEKESYRIITKDNTPIPVSKTGYTKLKTLY